MIVDSEKAVMWFVSKPSLASDCEMFKELK
jgi:hypothetical protein